MEKKVISPPFPFKIGGDPEFLMFHGSKALDTKAILRGFLANKTNIEPVELGFRINDIGEIGWDGSSSTGEIRPKASKNVATLTKRIHTLINTIYDNTPLLDITTLSIGSPIGGHIHLEIPESLKKDNQAHNWAKNNDKLINKIGKMMATFIMPIIASEHKISAFGRITEPNHQGKLYGQADDVLIKGHNDNSITLEIRGLSAEWLSSPIITEATLAYIGVCWDEIIKHHETLFEEPAILKTQRHIDVFQRVMLADNELLETVIIKKIRKLVRKFELYPKFKKEIELILHPDRAYKEKEKRGWNLKTGWILNRKEINPSRKDLLDKERVKKGLIGKEIIKTEEGFHIPYNDDYNIQAFAKSITDRIEILNWNLNNEYFLFGLKRNVEGFAAMSIEYKTFFSISSNVEPEETKESCKKMADRFIDTLESQMRIDPKTGRTRIIGKNQIVIGIPYNIRAEDKKESLIDYIWSIENKKMIPKDLKKFPETLVKDIKNSEQILEHAHKINRDRNQDYSFGGPKATNALPDNHPLTALELHPDLRPPTNTEVGQTGAIQ